MYDLISCNVFKTRDNIFHKHIIKARKEDEKHVWKIIKEGIECEKENENEDQKDVVSK